ncbi:hypothetical protein BD779DRAFT_1667202 [Infundibulicybe gibba]|nr:hypothetical protein BD779DRAFT_1667202 [Infundibulicybe gibba]
MNNSTGIGAQAPLSVNIVRGTHQELIVFLVLNMWPSHLGLPVLLFITLRSKQVQRHPTFYNLCISFIIVGISSTLLVYAGRTTGPEPSKLLCLLQASLLYGMPAITSLSAFALVFQMFIVIRASYLGQELKEGEHVLRSWAILVLPYFAFLLSVVSTAIVGANNPTKISRNRRFFYCSVDSLPLTNTITMVAAGILFSTFILEVWTMVILYKRWVVVRQKGFKLQLSMELSLPTRTMAFGFYIIIALSLSLLSIKSPESPVPDLVIASAATVALFIFGTQPDILRALCFWKGVSLPRAARVRAMVPDASWQRSIEG